MCVPGRDTRLRSVGNDEREQTLNQLLTELDGFESEKDAGPVICIAATNRPDVSHSYKCMLCSSHCIARRHCSATNSVTQDPWHPTSSGRSDWHLLCTVWKVLYIAMWHDGILHGCTNKEIPLLTPSWEHGSRDYAWRLYKIISKHTLLLAASWSSVTGVVRTCRQVLDGALLRPGRFDRRVSVERPDRLGREQILKVHIERRRLPLADDVSVAEVASSTVGFTGADLANLVNEAALLAGRESKGAPSTKLLASVTADMDLPHWHGMLC